MLAEKRIFLVGFQMAGQAGIMEAVTSVQRSGKTKNRGKKFSSEWRSLMPHNYSHMNFNHRRKKTNNQETTRHSSKKKSQCAGLWKVRLIFDNGLSTVNSQWRGKRLHTSRNTYNLISWRDQEDNFTYSLLKGIRMGGGRDKLAREKYKLFLCRVSHILWQVLLFDSSQAICSKILYSYIHL